jgi:hypothetical protein
MKRLLMKIPNFRLWYSLTNVIAAFETLAPRQESRSIHAELWASKTHRCKLSSHCGKRRHVAVGEEFLTVERFLR